MCENRGTPSEVTQSVEWAETAVPAALWEDATAQGLLPGKKPITSPPLF